MSDKIRCDACPVMCYIAPGQAGACDRYANVDGRIVRCDPLTVLDRTVQAGGAVVPFAAGAWAGEIAGDGFVTGIGAGTTQAAQELRDSKAVVLEFLMKDENSTRLVRSRPTVRKAMTRACRRRRNVR